MPKICQEYLNAIQDEAATFVLSAAQPEHIPGSSISRAVYEHVETGERWLAKSPLWVDYALRGLNVQGTQLDVLKEKIANDLYGYYGIVVPRLSVAELPCVYQTPDMHDMFAGEFGITQAPHVLSRWLDRFQTYPGLPVFSAHESRMMLVIDDQMIPEQGLGHILAVAHWIRDLDVIGGKGDNIGYRLTLDQDGKLVAQSCKIDPGWAFFEAEQPDKSHVLNEHIRLATMGAEGEVTLARLPQQTQDEFILTVRQIQATSDEVLTRFVMRPGTEVLQASGWSQRIFALLKARQAHMAAVFAAPLAAAEPPLEDKAVGASSPEEPAPGLATQVRSLLAHAQLKERDPLFQQAKHFYIEPNTAQTAQSASCAEEVQALSALYADFISDPQTRVLLLLGDAGLGKSTALANWYQQQWIHYLQSADLERVPLHLELKAFSRYTVGQCIDNSLLDTHHLNRTEIAQLKTQACILFLDGFDEIGDRHRCNLWASNQLSEWSDVRMVISCRSSDIEEHELIRYFAPEGAAHGLKVRYLAPFHRAQTEAYLQQALPPVDEAGVPLNLSFLQHESIFHLIRIPFLLKLFADAYPALRAQATDLALLNRTVLYDAFMQQWFAHNRIRLSQHLGRILSPQISTQFLRYSKDLAYTLFQARRIDVDYAPDAERAPWDRFFSHHDQESIELRMGCPLRRIGSQYSFIHKSMYEYFVAAFLWDALEQPEQRNTFWNTRLLTEERSVIDFLAEFYASNRPWNKGVMPHEHEEKKEEYLPQEDTIREDAANALWSLVLSSQHNAANAVAAANAATVLNAARVPFTQRDLSHTHLMGADLSQSICHGTDFSSANLSQVDFEGAWLSHASLRHTRLEGVELGELPYLACEDSANSCAYSPDGRWLAVALEAEIALYDTTTRLRVKTLQGHSGSVTSVAYSPSGEQLASGSNDNTLRLWSVRTGQCEKTLQGHSGTVTSVAYSPSGEQLASGSEDNTLRLWSVRTGQCEKTLQGHNSGVYSVAYSPSGEQLASGSFDGTLRLWSVRTGQCEKTLQGHNSGVYSVAYSPSGEQLASGSSDTTLRLRLWSVRTGLCEKTLQGHSGTVTSVAYSPSGEQLASGSNDYTLRLWSVRTGQCEKTLQGHSDRVSSVAYSLSGEQLASGSWDTTLRLWSVRTGQCEKTLQGHSGWVRSVAYNPSGEQLASGSDDHTLRLWSVRTGQCEKTLQGHSNMVISVACNPSKEQLASGSADNTLWLWSVRTGQCEKILQGHSNTVSSVAYSPSGEQLASGSWDDTLRLWSVRTGLCEKTLQGHSGTVYSVAYSPSGEQLASGSFDGTLRLWLVRTGLCEKTLQGHTSYVYSVAYSPSGEQLASGSWDKTLRLWSVRTGLCEKTLQGHSKAVISVAYSPSGEQLASGSADNTLRLWSVHPSNLGLELVCQDIGTPVTSLTWHTKEGALFLASGHGDASVRYWKYYCNEENQASLRLIWSSRQKILNLAGCDVSGVQGLSICNAALFQQRGALGKPLCAPQGKTGFFSHTVPTSTQQKPNAPELEEKTTAATGKKCVIS